MKEEIQRFSTYNDMTNFSRLTNPVKKTIQHHPKFMLQGNFEFGLLFPNIEFSIFGDQILKLQVLTSKS